VGGIHRAEGRAQVARYKRGTEGKRTDGRGIEGENRGNVQVAAVKKGTDGYRRPRYKGNRGDTYRWPRLSAVMPSENPFTPQLCTSGEMSALERDQLRTADAGTDHNICLEISQ
jgi:hypothetical protein